MIRILKAKDKVKFIEYCSEFIDKFEDNYITINRERCFLSNKSISTRVFNNIMKRGDKCFILEENGNIKGALIIVGFSDKFPRKYIKCLSYDEKINFKLFDFLLMNYNNIEMYLKIKAINPLCKIINIFNFKSFGFRGKEILFVKFGEKND